MLSKIGNEIMPRYMNCTLLEIGDWDVAEKSGRIKLHRDENGKPHRDGGPAVVDLVFDGYLWMQHGLVHRLNGPASHQRGAPGTKNRTEWVVEGCPIRSWQHYQKVTGCGDLRIRFLKLLRSDAFANVQKTKERRREKRASKSRFKFKFRLANYPDLFNMEWLEEVGFHSRGNPGGVNRDHRVSIADAIEGDYDPYYITHPINCELMEHTENSEKGRASSVTYEELMAEVHEYDAEAA